MTASRPQGLPENVIAGALFALLAIPVGVLALVLLWSVGFIMSIVGFLVAFCAVWLYRRGSGGVISRVGAWTITAIVAFTLLFGLWVSIVVSFADGIGHLSNLGLADYWPQFNASFPKIVNSSMLSILLVLAFGALGSYRTLGRAFATARQSPNPENLTGQASSLPQAPATYHDDLDAAPTGSADEKTAPPTTGN